MALFWEQAMMSQVSVSQYIDLLPAPGEWTEADYYPFSERGRLVELSDGNLEILDLPTDFHQLILMRLATALHLFVSANRLGQVRFAPLPVRLWIGKIREPDLVYMSSAHAARIGDYWGVPDLAVEIISQGSAFRDREIKRGEYMKAGVAEYWIVDPIAKTAEVLRGADYESAERFGPNGVLTSSFFEGFSLPLDELFREPE
jgi:Uma2 family endonuclease